MSDAARAGAAAGSGARQPPVAIVIPTFNRASTLGRAVDSALSQSYPAVRVIVVDDGSTDATAALLARYRSDPRVRVIVRPVNGGVTAAKNTGLDALPEDCVYFGILDSDDVLLPGALAALAAAFEGHPAPLSQVFGWCADAETGEPTGVAPRRAGPIRYRDALCGRFEGEFWQLVRRESLGAWRFDEGAAGNEAQVWWPLLKAAPGLLIDRVVRRYDLSGTDRVNRPAFTERGARRKLRGYAALMDRVGADMRAACPARYAGMMLECGKWAALAGERRAAWRAVRAALRAHPSLRVLKVAALLPLPACLLRPAYRRLYRDSPSRPPGASASPPARRPSRRRTSWRWPRR